VEADYECQNYNDEPTSSFIYSKDLKISNDTAAYDGNAVTALWNYAQHFAMSDNFYGSLFGPSVPGHLNLISGKHMVQCHQTSRVLLMVQ